VEVYDVKHLNRLIAQLRALRAVSQAVRVGA
jgi:hypothetical protein